MPAMPQMLEPPRRCGSRGGVARGCEVLVSHARAGFSSPRAPRGPARSASRRAVVLRPTRSAESADVSQRRGRERRGGGGGALRRHFCSTRRAAHDGRPASGKAARRTRAAARRSATTASSPRTRPCPRRRAPRARCCPSPHRRRFPATRATPTSRRRCTRCGRKRDLPRAQCRRALAAARRGAQAARARAGGPARSADVSARDAAAMVGLCDHLSLLTLQQRARSEPCSRIVLSSPRASVRSITSREAATSGDAAACPRQQSLRGAIRRQAHGLNQAIESLEQLRMLTDAVAAARPGSGQLDEERSNPLVTPIEGSVCSSAAAACSQAAEALRRARSALERLAPSQMCARHTLRDHAHGARMASASLLPSTASHALEQSAAAARRRARL